MDEIEDPRTRDQKLGRKGRWLLLLIFLLGLGLRGYGLLQPWNGLDFHSAFGTYATGVPARNFKLHGLEESKGMPWFWKLPREDGTVHHHWYTHHPATYFYLTTSCLHLFGDSRFSQSLPALLGSLLSILALYALARELWGPPAGLVAAALMAVIPMGSFYGVHPWTESIIQCLQILVLLHWIRWQRDRRPRNLISAALLLMVGAAFDWPALFILPGLGLYSLGCWIKEKRLAPQMPALLLPILGLLPVLAHRIHMSFALSEAELKSETKSTLEWAMNLPKGKTLGDHAELQWAFLQKYFGLPLLALVGLALAFQLLTLLRTRRATTQGALLALGLAGPIYVFLFRGRSWNHDFFWSLSLPYAALSVAGIAHAFLNTLKQSKAALTIVTVATLALSGWLTKDSLELWQKDTTPRVDWVWDEPWVDELVHDPDHVIIATYGYGMSFAYRGEATVLPDVNSMEALKRLKQKFLRHLPIERKVYFLFDGQVLQYYAPFLQELQTIDPKGKLHVLDQLVTRDLMGFQVFDLTQWVRS